MTSKHFESTIRLNKEGWVKQKRFSNVWFILKTESIVMHYEGQYIAFHIYTTGEKRHLLTLWDIICRQRKMDMNKAFTLAHQYKIPSCHTVPHKLVD